MKDNRFILPAAFALAFVFSCSSDGSDGAPGVDGKDCISGADGNQFCDTRDSKIYKKVKIGTQVWMAENLNYDVPGNTTDVCYDNNASHCVTYGRLYNWATALTACPSGWHIPSDAEWTALTDYVGGISTAGSKLKAASGWNSSGNGTDDYGFSALPGGGGNSDGSFGSVGGYGYWWSASEYHSDGAYSRSMYYDGSDVGRGGDDKTHLFAVRCLEDET